MPEEAEIVELIEQFRLGSESARTWLYKKLWDVAVVLVRMFVSKDQAEDVAQNAIIQVLGPRGDLLQPAILSYDATRPFYPWFVRVLSNRAIDHLRAEKSRCRRQTAVAERRNSNYEAQQSTVQMVGTKELLEQVREYRKVHLSAEQNALLERCLSGEPRKEIAKALGVPEGTVFSRYYYILQAMREHFSDDA